jgi:hypothetical protein
MESTIPFTEFQVGVNNDISLFKTPCNDLEKELHPFFAYRDVTPFITDQLIDFFKLIHHLVEIS